MYSPKDSEEILRDIEKNKIIGDLQSTKPQPKYKIHQTGEYAVVKLEAKVPIDAARRMVKEEVIEETKVKYYDDVQVVDNPLIHLCSKMGDQHRITKSHICKRNLSHVFHNTYG